MIQSLPQVRFAKTCGSGDTYGIGKNVININKIRKELDETKNSDELSYGQRYTYYIKPYGGKDGFSYTAFDDKARTSMIEGNYPPTKGGYIKTKYSKTSPMQYYREKYKKLNEQRKKNND